MLRKFLMINLDSADRLSRLAKYNPESALANFLVTIDRKNEDLVNSSDRITPAVKQSISKLDKYKKLYQKRQNAPGLHLKNKNERPTVPKKNNHTSEAQIQTTNSTAEAATQIASDATEVSTQTDVTGTQIQNQLTRESITPRMNRQMGRKDSLGIQLPPTPRRTETPSVFFDANESSNTDNMEIDTTLGENDDSLMNEDDDQDEIAPYSEHLTNEQINALNAMKNYHNPGGTEIKDNWVYYKGNPAGKLQDYLDYMANKFHTTAPPKWSQVSKGIYDATGINIQATSMTTRSASGSLPVIPRLKP